MTLPRTSPFTRLLAYYLLLFGAVWALATLVPAIPALLESFRQSAAFGAARVKSLGGASTGLEGFTQGEMALITLLSMLAALALVVPVAWVYMITKQRRGYDQSVVQTVIILPMTVAGTIVLVQNSLPLAFALGAVVAIVRFRNTLKDTKDTVYIFLALGVGVAAGVFSPSVAAVMSLLYNLTVLFLWRYNVGNIYADQLGRTAPLLAALTPDQLDEVADRAARLQAYVAARSRDDKKKRFTAVVLVHTKDSKAAQLAVEPILEDRTKRWRLAEILPDEGGASTLEYLVRLKDDVEAAGFLDQLQRDGAPAVVAAEYRSLRGLKRDQE
jgi:uncharacterized protein DUF4956